MEDETMNQFVCSFQGCLRKFNTLESLKLHIERRHSQVTKTELPKIIQTRKVKKISLPIYSRKGQFGLKPPGLKELAANFQNSSQLMTIKEKMMKKYEGINIQKTDKMSTVKLEPLLKRENSMPKIKRQIDRSSQDDPESTIISQKEEEKHSSQSVRKNNQQIQTTVSSGFDEIAFKTTQNFPKVQQQQEKYQQQDNNTTCDKFSQLFELSNDLYTDENLPKIDIRPCSRPTTQQIIFSKQKLTKQFILQNAPGFNEIEDITQLILRGKERTAKNASGDDDSLYVFEESNDFNPAMLVSLEFISLSHNQIKNLAGVGKCESLLELNINFNNITELGPLRNCLNLRKLWASNNFIESVHPLLQLEDLEVVSLYTNNLKSFEEVAQVFQQLPKLKELDLESNPCCRRFSYKYDILWCLKALEKLDGEQINEYDYELSRTFQKELSTKLST